MKLTLKRATSSKEFRGGEAYVEGESGIINGLVFTASELRESSTGTHALIKIFYHDSRLVFDTYNLGRVENSRKLIRMARDSDPELSTQVIAVLYKELENFVQQCKNVWLGQISPVLLEGDLSREPIPFRVFPHVIEGGGTILFGDPASLKSYTLYSALIATDSGTNGIWSPQQDASLLVNLERPVSTIKRRISHISQSLGLSPKYALHTLNARGIPLKTMRQQLESYIQQYDIKFIGLDSISRSGISSKDEEDANSLIDLLNSFQISWMAIGHVGHTDKSRLYGSILLEASADIVLKATSVKPNGDELKPLRAVHIESYKVNDIPPPPGITIEFSFDQSGLSGIQKSSLEQHPDLFEAVTGQSINDSDRLKAFVLAKGKVSPTAASMELGLDRKWVSRQLNGQNYVMVETLGRENFYGVKQHGHERGHERGQSSIW